MKAVAFSNNDVAVVAWTFGGKTSQDDPLMNAIAAANAHEEQPVLDLRRAPAGRLQLPRHVALQNRSDVLVERVDISIKLDDPSFNASIHANLFDDEDGERLPVARRGLRRILHHPARLSPTMWQNIESAHFSVDVYWDQTRRK